MNAEPSAGTAPRGLVIAAFAAIYVFWGSTYLVIRYAIESIPPLMMIGSRFFFAGVVLFAWARCRGATNGTAGEWINALIAGSLMLFIGTGLIAWAEQYVPSSIAALVVALMPLWMLLLDWKNSRPTRLVVAGLIIGFVGVALLAKTGRGYQNEPLSPFPMGVMLGATIAWALGSQFSRHAARPASTLIHVAMQMICGGAVLLLVALLCGELNQFSLSQLTYRSMLAWTYLVVVGSFIGYPAYIWLLRASTPARVSTYAFVNPLIAVALGCTIGAEPFSGRLLFSAFMIVTAVVLIIYRPRVKPASSMTSAELCEVEK